MQKKHFILLCVWVLVATLVVSIPMVIAQGLTAKDLVAEAKQKISQISVSEAKAKLDEGKIIFLDVREPKEFEAGHVPGARNIPRGLVEFEIDKVIPDKNAQIVVYCKTGGRGALATDNLNRMGYKNAVNMDGGWTAWTMAGYPVE